MYQPTPVTFTCVHSLGPAFLSWDTAGLGERESKDVCGEERGDFHAGGGKLRDFFT
jgi:hypothetical protein